MAQTIHLKPIIDLNECLRDSPKFRFVLEQNEKSTDEFEIKIDKLIKLCHSMVEIGKAFIKAKSNFINGVWDLLVYFKDDSMMVNNLNRMVQTLTELLKYDTILLDQANRAVGKNLSNFLYDDITKVKDTKRHFDKISDDLDNVLTRHSQCAKSKPNECEETKNILTATRSCFQHTALDYVTQISCLNSKKRHEVLDSILSLMHAYGTYYHQGSDLFQDFDVYRKKTANNIIEMRDDTNLLEKKLESRHTLVSSKDIIPVLTKSDGVRLEGYLFKRTSNAFKTWNRRWFIIQDHKLVYHKRNHDNELTIMEEDLRLCTAKPVTFEQRRFCFEVLSPSKFHILQADSVEACQQWITALQAGIDAAYNNNDQIEAQSVDSQDSWCTASSNSTSKSSTSINNISSQSNPNPPAKPPRVTYAQILALAGNEFCGDCGCADPKWASINLGVTLCIECSGIHRSLGVHYSKVRSLNLDAWDMDQIKVMTSLGNSIVNNVYEAKVDETVALRATPECNRTQRELWIKAKYIKKAFLDNSTQKFIKNDLSILPSLNSVQPLDSNRDTELNTAKETIDQLISTDLENKNCEKLKESVGDDQFSCETPGESNSSDVLKPQISTNSCQNLQNTSQQITNENCDNNFYNLLLYTASINCDIPTMCEALAKGADVNWINDSDLGRNALHQAICSESVIACEYLLLNGAKCNASDRNKKTAIHLATELGNTGQVCLLLKRGADQTVIDSSGNDALTIAINNANADIVTLLRLAKLNEEMKNDEFGNPNDETFNEVVRDFSQLASNSPEKLRRQNQNSSS